MTTQAEVDALSAESQKLAIAAADAWQKWRMMRSVSYTDGTSGFLYQQAYEAQMAADAAYTAFLTAQNQLFGKRG